jgi:hypothetical protein
MNPWLRECQISPKKTGKRKETLHLGSPMHNNYRKNEDIAVTNDKNYYKYKAMGYHISYVPESLRIFESLRAL